MDINYIDIKEFKELGLLQEINRRFLHPIGLALEVAYDKETGDMWLGGIWDYRDDEEGMLFGEVDPEKMAYYDTLFDAKARVRLEKYGWVIQPPSS